MIELKDIKKIFQTKKGTVEAVNGVNLSIESGDIYGIVGYSGAGKSTLIRMFNGLEAPSSGTVSVNGKVISTLKGSSLRKERQKIGMVFQHFNLLWSRTVVENILFPLEIAGVPKEKRLARANELVKLVGLEGREDAYPAQLSGGQKQRVGIARSLANDPTLLLCDEATSALDPQTTDEVLDLLLDINKRLNLTIVLITHEMHVIRKICDKVAVMESGKIVEHGNVMDVFKRPKEEVTKRFIRQDSNDEEDTHLVLEELLAEYPDGKVVRLTFHGEQAKLPIISKIVKEDEVDLTIIEGNIKKTQEGAIGSLYVQLMGQPEKINQAIENLRKMRVEVEVITDVK
ncbi:MULTISPECIES: methionine ABC transporter ATP-binding protein [Carnobacterium]|jgi:D-methionine transport system ATP-binding protein|uniref:Methionine import ATP-binding protein MetN 2 n=2 Tax=Carnobacterium maltaromaticum TaxID=2751 RepID=K8EPK3_CARML|nr:MULTISPECIES: methionine ABC transporter ATP-binding protein [Carnobacterium]AOA01373.1 methionine ABC transporter ATP-binding protein [Carnobacterium maltaromaticum]KRN60285.1 ABC transporter, ATP-binding protein [Carnobacterium maltaromaticum DSM 20342]KRN85114.1 ABC transporter, ATP-binding protein [Carnobacterium maltaromaticum]MBC9808318.1 ATP-binding cassette domain-containing protein [Carnobacterium maltaromaticum]MBQ6484942.1 methionine ABC transporter ATP-binding protein [Carnobact